MSESIITTLIQSAGAIAVAIIGGIFGIISLKKKNKSQKLKYHPVFAKIDFDKELVRTFEFKNKGKETIFKDVLKNHLNIYNDILKELAESIDSNLEMDSTELCNRAITAVSDIKCKLYSFYLNDDYNESERKAITIVLDKYSNWNFNRDKNMIDMITHVCGSNFYTTTYNKSVTILDLFLFSITETIEDANKTLNSLNGDLKGLTFKGVEM